MNTVVTGICFFSLLLLYYGVPYVAVSIECCKHFQYMLLQQQHRVTKMFLGGGLQGLIILQ